MKLELPIAIELADCIMAFYMVLPAYATNSTPTIFGGGQPIDFEKRFLDGERIFGSNKTVRGFVGGLVCGSLMALAEELFLSRGLFQLGFLVSLGSLFGDLLGAFLKRRLKIAPGSPLPIVDQLDFIFGAIVLTYPLYKFSLGVVLLLVLVTLPIHIVGNVIAYALGLKKTFM